MSIVDIRCTRCGDIITTLESTAVWDFVDVVGIIETAGNHGSRCIRNDAHQSNETSQ